MAKDKLLGNYSGIEGIDPETMGTVVVGRGILSHYTDEYGFISTKFILINDYVIAVDMYSFFQLQRYEQ
jgi:hypothetical protein